MIVLPLNNGNFRIIVTNDAVDDLVSVEEACREKNRPRSLGDQLRRDDVCVESVVVELEGIKADEEAINAEYAKIVKDMQAKAKEYGYDQCVDYLKKEAERRKACEDAVKKTE